jgi:predicted GNAT family acetyltransferase
MSLPSSPSSPNEIVVHHNVLERRFEAIVDGHLSVADYVVEAGTVTFTHTFVPPELRGRGVAEKLVRAALAWAAEEKRRVIPACSYVARFVERHAEFRGLVS